MSREMKPFARVLVFVFGLAVALGAVLAWTQLSPAPSAYAAETGGDAVVADDNAPVTEDVTADVPTSDGYDITVDSAIQHGKVASDKNSALEGEQVKLTATPDAGYRLKSMTLEFDGEGSPITATTSPYTLTMPGSSVNVTAAFEEIPTYDIKLTVDPTGSGTATASVADKTVTKATQGDTVTLTAKAADGYEFDKWEAITKDLVIKDGKFTMPGTAVEVKAVFKAKAAPATNFTVSFDKNASDAKGTMSALTVESGKSATLTVNAFTREGYDFTGWNTTADGKGTAYADKATVTPTGNMTLYAQWKAKEPAVVKYTVSFDANGGTGTMDALTVESGKSVTLTANAFKRTGYTFNGWNTQKDGKGTAYKDKAEVTPVSDMTLYAQWKKTSTTTTPKTGDTNLPLVAGLATVALLAGAALALSDRKRREED